MSDTNEEYQTHHEEYLEKQKEIVEDELDEEHADLILDFLYDRKSDLAPSTARNYARELRYLIKYTYGKSYEDIEDWDANTWEELIRRVARERDIGDGTKRNTCYAVRAFVDWYNRSDVDKDDIDAPKITHSKIDEDVVLKPQEVVELIEKCNNARNKAIIGVMYECGLRRTALVQLDVNDYKTDQFNRIRVPIKTGVKTGHGRERPLNWSAGYLDTWLTEHPNSGDDEAPLFCSIRDGRDKGKRLSSHSIYTMMKRVADRVDIDNDRVHPHALRHSRATAMRKSDKLDKRDIETVLGWTESTPMHSRYEHTTSTEDASRTAKRMGVDVQDEDQEQLIKDCPRCNSNLPPNVSYCPTCTLKIADRETPKWWVVYKNICKDTDPILKKYDDVTNTIPLISELSIQELDHIHTVFNISVLKRVDEDQEIDPDHPFDDVSEFDSLEFDEFKKLMRKIRKEMSDLKTEDPTSIDLISDSLRVGDDLLDFDFEDG